MSNQIVANRELVLIEHVELVVPVAYLLCLVAAYYGPNAEMFGNIKFGGWHYTAITDINRLYKNLCLLFFVDMCSVILCSIILWVTCKINLLRVYIQMLKNFWLLMAVQTAFLLDMVSVVVHCYDAAMDMCKIK